MRLILLILSAVALFAQKANIPRMPDGKPDLSGVYQANSTIPGAWEEANAGNGLGGTGKNPNAPIAPSSTDRQGEAAPYQPWAAAKVLESYRNRAIDDPTARCLPPGSPRLHSLGLFPIQFAQRPDQLIILYEYMNVFRVIPLNGKHSEDAEPTYLGDSAGHWESDTLVVDVTNLNDKTWLIGAGTFHSDKLHLVERFTRVSKDRVDYEVRMEDPTVFTKPWIVRNSMMLREGTRVREYPCAENNSDIEQYEKLIKSGVKFTR